MNEGTTTNTTTSATTAPGAADGGVPMRKASRFQISRAGILALRRNDVSGFLLAEFGEKVRDYPEERVAELRHLAVTIIAMRQEQVAAIGDDEMFVVRLANGGQLQRVTHRVQLSLGRKELFQIPKRVNENGEWVSAPAEPGIAQLTVAGYDAINRVVGCSVALPPTITVDGVERQNPYTERYPDTENTIGDVRRMVICVVVAGMSQIGTPVVVRYTYEYEPSKELLHALGRLATETVYKTGQRKYEGVELVDAAGFRAFVESQKDPRARWKYVPAYAGVGYACNLANPDVGRVFHDILHVSREAGKKAITVARRNAMRAHPALSRGAIEIDQRTGIGMVTVNGWTANRDAVRDYSALMADLASGVHNHLASSGVQVIERAEAFESSADPDTIDALDEDDAARRAAQQDDDEIDAARAALEQRGALIAAIHTAAASLTPNQATIATSGLEDLTVAQLQERLDETNALG